MYLLGLVGVRAAVICKKEDRVLTGRQPWELRSCELVFASVKVLHSVAAGHRRNNVLEKERAEFAATEIIVVLLSSEVRAVCEADALEGVLSDCQLTDFVRA